MIMKVIIIILVIGKSIIGLNTMERSKDRWSTLSIKEKAQVIQMFVDFGIKDLKEIKDSYNGVPYADLNSSDYDYYNAHPDNMPSKPGEHWTSRNPKTGRLLKGSNHPTYDLMIEGEKKAGYDVYRGIDGGLYSRRHNYVDSNELEDGGPTGSGKNVYNSSLYNHKEESKMYSYLREQGVPHTQAAAIMGNIAVESYLNPKISQIGGGGGYGLIQATDPARKNSFINYVGQPYSFGSGLSQESQRQLDYIVKKGLDTYTVGEWRKVQGTAGARDARKKFLETNNIKKASDLFTDSYLRPGKPHKERRQDMTKYYDNKYGGVEKELKKFGNYYQYYK